MTKLTAGKNPPQQINVFVEIPQGGDIKYELDRDSGVVFVDRFLYTAFTYPFNYGFVPGTKADDVSPGTVIPAVTIGMLEMEDEEGIDTKILAVPTLKVDPYYGAWKDIADVPQAIKDKIKHFFEHYKELEPGKWVKIKDWKNKAAAMEDIKKALPA